MVSKNSSEQNKLGTLSLTICEAQFSKDESLVLADNALSFVQLVYKSKMFCTPNKSGENSYNPVWNHEIEQFDVLTERDGIFISAFVQQIDLSFKCMGTIQTKLKEFYEGASQSDRWIEFKSKTGKVRIVSDFKKYSVAEVEKVLRTNPELDQIE